MGLDRFVYWKERRPTATELEQILRNYFDAAAQSFAFAGARWTITLFGRPTSPFKGIAGAPAGVQHQQYAERWIEVHVHDDCIDIETKQQDDYTNDLAGGLQAAFLRFYGASDKRLGTTTEAASP